MLTMVLWHLYFFLELSRTQHTLNRNKHTQSRRRLFLKPVWKYKVSEINSSWGIRSFKHLHMRTNTHMHRVTWDCPWTNTCRDVCINTQHYNKSQTGANRAAAGDTGYSYPTKWEVTARVFSLSLLTKKGHLCVWFHSMSVAKGLRQVDYLIRLTMVLFSGVALPMWCVHS